MRVRLLRRCVLGRLLWGLLLLRRLRLFRQRLGRSFGRLWRIFGSVSLLLLTFAGIFTAFSRCGGLCHRLPGLTQQCPVHLAHIQHLNFLNIRLRDGVGRLNPFLTDHRQHKAHRQGGGENN